MQEAGKEFRRERAFFAAIFVAPQAQGSNRLSRTVAVLYAPGHHAQRLAAAGSVPIISCNLAQSVRRLGTRFATGVVQGFEDFE